MTSVVFVAPAAGRLALAEVCLRQLGRTCAELAGMGIHASATVAADDENLETARALGFEALERPNDPLGRKWNDLYEHAWRAGADYVVPIGTDDMVDARLIAAQLDTDGELRCSRLAALVREDGRRLAPLRIPYDGGIGIRVMPAALLAPAAGRPMDDWRDRGLDTSALRRLTSLLGRKPYTTYLDLHPLQIVDFKSGGGQQLNGYAMCAQYLTGGEVRDPWARLAEHYPEAADVRALYESGAIAATPATAYRAGSPGVPGTTAIHIPVTRQNFTRLPEIIEATPWV